MFAGLYQVFQYFYYVKKNFWPKGGHGRFGQGVNTPLVRRSSRNEAPPHIAEHYPFKVQTKHLHIIIHTFIASLPPSLPAHLTPTTTTFLHKKNKALEARAVFSLKLICAIKVHVMININKASIQKPRSTHQNWNCKDYQQRPRNSRHSAPQLLCDCRYIRHLLPPICTCPRTSTTWKLDTSSTEFKYRYIPVKSRTYTKAEMISN